MPDSGKKYKFNTTEAIQSKQSKSYSISLEPFLHLIKIQLNKKLLQYAYLKHIAQFKMNKLYPFNKVNNLKSFTRNTILLGIVPFHIILLSADLVYYSLQHKTISRAPVTMT